MFDSCNKDLDIVLFRQDSLGRERYSRNGTNKDIHVVSKNLPFHLEISSTKNLKQADVTCALYYDAEDLNYKLVDQLRQDPLIYQSIYNAPTNRIVVECRINALTSQHEDSLFLVKVLIKTSHTKQAFCFSEPIKVVSKPCVVNRKKKVPTSRKHSDHDTVLSALARLEKQQSDQRELIENFLRMQNAESNIELAFKAFLSALNQIPSEEKPHKIRKLLHNVSDSNHHTLTEFIQFYEQESISLIQKNPQMLELLLDGISLPE